MKNWMLAFMGIGLIAIFSIANAAPTSAALDQATKDDIARHRAMSVAHENAAKCLEAGKSDAECEKQLQIECQGLGIGKFCGMKHTH